MRVSVTTIEQFRRVCETEYANEAELVAQVRRDPFEPTWQMRAGSAWDAVLTRPEKWLKVEQRGDGGIDAWYECNGHVFDGDDVAEALERIGGGVVQVKHTMAVPTRWGEVTVVGVADAMNGLVVTDNKAKFSPPDPTDYDQSLQWRFYLRIFNAACFRYLMYEFKEPGPDRFCVLKSIHETRFWPYDTIESDCLGWLLAFLEWCERNNLLHYLEREGSR